MPDPAADTTEAVSANGASDRPRPGLEATLNRALAGAGAGGDGAGGLPALRERARRAAEALPTPVWRRSGFWTTSLRELALEDLSPRTYAEPAPALSAELAELVDAAPRAGLVIVRGDSVVHCELADGLAERGVLLCPLEDAAREHADLFDRYYLRSLTVDRDRIEALAAANWRGGAFLYVPPELSIPEPFHVVHEIDEPGTAQYGHTLAIADRGSEIVLRDHGLGARELDGQALHAAGFELYLEEGARCRLSGVHDWGPGEVFDVSRSVVSLARDAYCHWLPAVLGGHLVRRHLELAIREVGADMAFRGVFFAEGTEHLDLFAVDLHETGPSGGDVHWRGAATGSSRASFEGLIQIDPGAQQTHTYLQIHTMMLSPQARIDAIPSVLVSSDDVSASHGGTVGELDDSSIFYMRTRGLSRAQAVRVIVEGFFEPIIGQLEDPSLEEAIRRRVAAKLAAAEADIEAFAAAR